MAGEVDGVDFGVADADLGGVFACVELGVDVESGAAAGRGDEVDDDLQREERFGAPVAADEAEEAVLDLVPLARPGREVADADPESGLVGQLLQLGLPLLASC